MRNYLKELPEIPKQLKTESGTWASYTITEEDGVPWAQPVGDWDDAYRK